MLNVKIKFRIGAINFRGYWAIAYLEAMQIMLLFLLFFFFKKNKLRYKKIKVCCYFLTFLKTSHLNNCQLSGRFTFPQEFAIVIASFKMLLENVNMYGTAFLFNFTANKNHSFFMWKHLFFGKNISTIISSSNFLNL